MIPAPIVHAPHSKGAIQQQREVIATLFPIRPSLASYTDPRACRHYLCGLCPADLFLNTKFALPPCGKEHDEVLRSRYEAAVAGGAPSFAGELLAWLEELLLRNDREVARLVARAEDEQPGAAVPVVETERTPQVEELKRAVEAKMREEGLNEETEALQRELWMEQARAARAPPPPHPSGKPHHGKYRLCSACKNVLILTDADERMADHFKGRIHLGWMAIFEKAAALRKERGGGAR